ncbi:hypothetical protein SAMN05216455_10226 [Segatella bryantii]|jgi:hypothetical protein|uniref:hypothetical protein n=1 Tax=Segatella bryantii TaxID=77095 RepID=UPI00089691D6|nr:hypothetical protein [Segatella bryantii]SDZ94720.1 hypothetical protein SAMN05216455_10226 [Segatella bryantii]
MALNITKSISGKYFSSTIPDVEFTISGVSAGVTMTCGGQQIYNETLFPISGKVSLRDLSNLVTPYARQQLVVTLSIAIRENVETGTGGSQTLTAQVIYCAADFDTDADTFCENHFLSILLGQKITSLGRLEFLHYLGTDAAQVTAEYSDGTAAIFTPPKVQGNANYSTIDVSPDRFRTEGKTLVGFTARAGDRYQEFVIDLDQPDCAPILIFVNSFGCEELVYCTGTHKVSPSYKRTQTYFEGIQKNYLIEETRTFKADSGVLNVAMQNWLDDLFRSEYVRVVNIYNGQPTIGKEVLLTDSKSEVSNDDDELTRFTFSYQYAQRNQNVVDLRRAGRIFDNTFDYTFN